ncbi:MAG: enoyl-CoA hydratase [Alphaproteobacteria bacterium]|nr:enoyl-CoA hydratase [Alphaproteobacteria bacterium]
MKLATEKMIAEKDGPIGWMVFNNPERRNALSVEMREAMLQIIEDFAADDSIRVVVMKGAGDKAFVSGADISQFEKERASDEQRQRYMALSNRVERALTTLEKPLVAMIRGYCLGGGLGVALTADIRVAAEDAQFGIPAARLSIGYPFEAIRKVMDLVGPSRTKDILFTARRIAAAEALAIGLVNRVVPVPALEDEVRAMAEGMAVNAPLTIRATKACVAEALKDESVRDRARCDALVDACMAGEDYVEGRSAFMEKRPPVFKGR